MGNYFKSPRWNAGIQNEVNRANAEFENTEGATDIFSLVGVPVADLALRYYDRRIKAYFYRAGIDLGDDVLTVESMREKVQTATGLEIDDFSSEGLMRAVERPLARQVSELLGFEVTEVFDQEVFRAQVKAHVLERLLDGEGGGILRGQTLHRLREAATWINSGAGMGQRRKILNRIYHRRYRAGHGQTWI